MLETKIDIKKTALLVIEHNVDAIATICDRLVFLNQGDVVVEGTPGVVRSDPRVVDAYLGASSVGD